MGKYGIADIILGLFAIFVSLSVHEFGHAYIAYRCGDDTAARQGRLTLNPLAHMDPVGTIFIVMIALTSVPLIGWAKPVPVNPYKMNKPDRDHMLVAAAGPAFNVLLALLAAVIYHAVYGVWAGSQPPQAFISLMWILHTFVAINIGLACFNLIPLGPLDGSTIFHFFLPREWKEKYENINQYGMLILFALIFSGQLSFVFKPVWALTDLFAPFKYYMRFIYGI